MVQANATMQGVWASDDNEVLCAVGSAASLAIQMRKGERIVSSGSFGLAPDGGYVGKFWSDVRFETTIPFHTEGYKSLAANSGNPPQAPRVKEPNDTVFKDSQYCGEGRFASTYTNPQGQVIRTLATFVNSRRKLFYSGKFSKALELGQLSFAGTYKDKDIDLALNDNPGASSVIGGALKVGSTSWMVSGERRGLWGRLAFISSVTGRIEGTANIEWEPTEARVRDMVDKKTVATDRMRIWVFLSDQRFPSGALRYIRTVNP